MMRFGDFPPSGDMGNVDPDWIGHAQLVFENATMMFSDDPAARHRRPITSRSLGHHGRGQAARGLAAVCGWRREGERRTCPTFWAKLYGNLTDPFGVSWLLMYSDDNFEMPG